MYLDNTTLILLEIICGCIAALISILKGGKAITWGLAGLLLGPLGIILTIFMAGPRCHNCKSRIHKDAKVCPHCLEKQDTDSDSDDSDQTGASLETEKKPGDPF